MFNSKLRSPLPVNDPLNDEGNVLISIEVFSRKIVNRIFSMTPFSFSFNFEAISCLSSPIDLKLAVVIFIGSAHGITLFPIPLSVSIPMSVNSCSTDRSTGLGGINPESLLSSKNGSTT